MIGKLIFVFCVSLMSLIHLLWSSTLSTLTAIWSGGILRRFVESRKAADPEELHQVRERGILFGSGLIAGEGLLGVGIAAWAFFAGRKPDGIGYEWMGAFAPYLSLILFLGLGFMLVRSTRR